MWLRVTMVAVTLAGAFGAGPVRAADDGPLTAKSCIIDKDSDFHDDHGKYTFTMNLENVCDRPITCTIDAYVTSARGPTSGHAILLIGARGQTPTAKAYTLKVKLPSGSAETSRVCSFL